MKSCTIITCNNCEFYNTQYCKNCSKEGDNCYEHWEWRHDVSWRQEQIDNLTQKISDLEAKLAEYKLYIDSFKHSQDLDKQYISKLESDLAEKCRLLKTNETILSGTKFIEEEINQDKISFAVEQLEKVKEYAQHIQGGLINYIDQQIKELKEGK